MKRLTFLVAASLSYSCAFADGKECTFATLNGKDALGANATHFTGALGQATGGNFAGERSWGLTPAQFAQVALFAPEATDVGVSTYRGKIHRLDIAYPVETRPIEAMESNLSKCFARLTSRCWASATKQYYITAQVGAQVGLIMFSPEHAPPQSRGVPVNCRAEPRSQQ